MAAVDRRVIFSSHVVAKESTVTEEAIPSKWTIHPSVGKTLGGKGIITDLNNDQWADGWTSMLHENLFWEGFGDNWENALDYWTGTADVGTSSGVQLSIRSEDLSFCYIKNTGDTYDLSVSIDGEVSFPILVPPGGSVHFRGAGSVPDCEDIFIKAVGGDTTAEFIIAEK